MRCVAHITNLAVQDLLGELTAEEPSSAASSLDDGTTTRTGKMPCVAKPSSAIWWSVFAPLPSVGMPSRCGAKNVACRARVSSAMSAHAGTPRMP